MSARIRHGSIFLPLVLIGLGIVFLLTNLGVVDWDVWESLVLFWPVLLIALGLDLILGRGILRGLLAFAIVAVVLGGVAFAVYEFGGSERWAETTEPVSQALEGASRAEVRLAFGSGTLEVGALADPALLVQGEIAVARHEDLRRSFSVVEGTARFSLETKARFPHVGRGHRRLWSLDLNPAVPLSLIIGSGVGEARLNLADLNLTRFELGGGVGEAEISLPGRGRFEARIGGGVGRVTVRVPASLGVRIEAAGGLGSIHVPSDYARGDRIYTSPNYATAESRVDLRIAGGVGEVRVELR